MVGITGYITGFAATVGNHVSELSAGEAIIFDIAIILILAAIFAFIAKILRQPLILGYVLAGLVIGPLVLGFVENSELITAFSEIGIALLLFVTGLEISFRKIKEANLKKIAVVGVLQVAAIFAIVFFLNGFLGLSQMQAAYLGIILAFGSTMVDVKLLADRGELVTLHGRLVLGILLLQDLVAIIAIIMFTTGEFAVVPMTIAFAKLIGIVIFAMLLNKYVLSKFFNIAAKSTELLFLSSLAVLFLFIILSSLAEISIIIGAFIAGVSLANSPFKSELESRISPLRDFFAILFFVALGMQVVFVGVGERMTLFWALLLGAFIIKPVITLILLRVTGYRPKTSFFTAISLAQLSEFSLIILLIGKNAGIIDAPIASTVILATIISMAVTPYFIDHKEFLYRFFRYPIKALKFLPMRENLEYENKGDKEILLVGAHRVGAVLLKELMEKKDKLMVIDYNPEIINALIKNKVSCIYGDVYSPEILRKFDTKKLKTVISTVPNYDENIHILRVIKRLNPRAKVIVTGSRISETKKLYKAGADYVITPKILAGEKMEKIIHSKDYDLKKAKRKHLRQLADIHKILY